MIYLAVINEVQKQNDTITENEFNKRNSKLLLEDLNTREKQKDSNTVFCQKYLFEECYCFNIPQNLILFYNTILKLAQMEKINKDFYDLADKLKENQCYKQALLDAQKKYCLKIYKIEGLTPGNVEELYEALARKFYINRKLSDAECWFENQLKIFIWVLVGYLFIENKTIQELNQQNWRFFSQMFNFRKDIFFQYQSLSLLRCSTKFTKWTPQESQLLQQIMQNKLIKNKWNSIARDLFQLSKKKCYRSPKQCRQHWINHLDPSKSHNLWTDSEDLTLMNCIKKNGKKWSIAMKELRSTRTQHMVKNRYKSLILHEKKKCQNKRDFQIENIIIKKLRKKFVESKDKKRKQSIISSNKQLEVISQNQKKINEELIEQKENEIQEKMDELQSKIFFQEHQYDLKSPSLVAWKGEFFKKDEIDCFMRHEPEILQQELFEELQQ